MTASQSSSALRLPGLNEQRCIARHHLDFYRGLLVAGAYRFARKIHLEALYVPLAATVKQHPILTAVIRGVHAEQPRFYRLAAINLDEHVVVLGSDDLGMEVNDSDVVLSSLMARLAEYAHNLKFSDVEVIPPWKLLLLPMGASTGPVEKCLIAYVYSHSIGDGTSGMAFHRSFLEALNAQSLRQGQKQTSPRIVEACVKGLPPTIDSPELLPISWIYLIKALLGGWSFRSWLASFVFNKPQPDVWTGSPHIYDPTAFKTALDVVMIDHDIVEPVIIACRERKAKFTGVFHEMIAAVLAKQLDTNGTPCARLISSIPINLRHLSNMSPDDMGVMASAVSFVHDVNPAAGIGSNSFWQASCKTTDRLTEAANTLSDQAIGLLRYLSSLRSWMLAKIGKPRETSYELSNVMIFQPIPSEHQMETSLDCMIFSQPGDVVGPAMSINLVSVKKGPLVMSIAWQVGALTRDATTGSQPRDIEAAEREFVAGMVSLLRSAMTDLGRSARVAQDMSSSQAP